MAAKAVKAGYTIAFLIWLLACALALFAVTPADASPINYRYRALAALALRPRPLPQPTPASDVCENCNGTGKLGDGTVSVTCPVCDGTGKVKASLPSRFGGKALHSILALPGAASTAGPDKDSGAGTPQRTLRQTIKGVIYSMDGCGPCERLLEDCKVVLPAAKWTLGEAKDFADACAGECDFYHVHQPSGRETFDSYPTFAVYRNGMMVKRWWGPMTAKNCAERWLEVYNEQLEARAK